MSLLFFIVLFILIIMVFGLILFVLISLGCFIVDIRILVCFVKVDKFFVWEWVIVIVVFFWSNSMDIGLLIILFCLIIIVCLFEIFLFECLINLMILCGVYGK